MRKTITSLACLCLMLSAAEMAGAQVQPRTDKRIRTNLGSPRFAVLNPSTLAGIKTITMADWGGQAPLVNAPVARGLDSLALNPLINPGDVNGKVALLFRGAGVTFAQKVQYAYSAGAIGVIIVNNIPGDPTGMSNTGTITYNIPIVMVSDVVGNAINNALRAAIPVNVSIGPWGLNLPNDLAVLPGYQSLPHALNIPYSQLSVGAGSLPYRNFQGGAIVNYGTAAQSNINVLDSVVWNPTGGAPSTVHQGSYNVTRISALDSVQFGFGANTSSWSLPAPASTGFYTYNYRLTYGNTDATPEDNIYSYRQYVTDSIFCKSTYDYTTNAPHVTLGIQPSTSASPFSLGPIFYVADGKYAARKLQFSLLRSAQPDLAGVEAFALLYKWKDGLNSQPIDSFIQALELELVGVTRKAFASGDSSGDPVTVNLLNALSPSKPIILDSNSWYWAAAQGPMDTYVGVDESVSYFTRPYTQSQVYNYQEHPMILFIGDHVEIATASGAVATFPFAGHGLLADSSFFDRFYYTPAVALHISKNKVGLGINEELVNEMGNVTVSPVPANEVLKVDVRLNRNFANMSYRLLDIGGRVVYKMDKANVQNDQLVIPTGSLSSGVYHLYMSGGGTDMITRRVIIQH